MHRILLICLLVLYFQVPSPAQPQRTRIDSLTWDLYSAKKWESLLQETRKSLQKGTDFYYLRVRAGVAAYELRNYRLSVTHFRKAYQAYQNDDFVNASYYWALLLSGREDEANGLADSFPAALLKEMNIRKKGVLSSISSESLLSVNRNISRFSVENLGQQEGNPVFRSLMKQQFYQGISADLHLLPHLNLYHHFSFMDIRRSLQFNDLVNLPENFKEPDSKQYQYYLGGRYFTAQGWDMHASFTTLWGGSNYYYPSSFTGGKADLSVYSWNIRDFAITCGFEKDMTYLKPGFELGYGEINRLKQWQGSMSLAIYPFGNPDFYLVPEATLHKEEGADKTELILHPLAGLRTGPVWLTGEFTLGKMQNCFLRGGQVVYNMPEAITGQWGMTLWAPVFKNRMNLTLKFLQSEKEGTSFVFSDAVNYETSTFYFTDFTFLISLRWSL